jgi:hypothetical protein
MTWASASPLESTWKDKELYVFLREIFVRGRTFGTFTWDPPNVPGTSTVDTTLTTTTVAELKGLRVGQPVFVSPPSTINAGIVFGGAWVATDDTLTIRLGNVTAGPINPASGTWAFQGVIA